MIADSAVDDDAIARSDSVKGKLGACDPGPDSRRINKYPVSRTLLDDFRIAGNDPDVRLVGGISGPVKNVLQQWNLKTIFNHLTVPKHTGL